MNKIFLVFISACFCVFSQDIEKSVTFIIHTPQSDDSSIVFITGNHEKLGNWNPSSIPLIQKDSITWEIILSFPPNEMLEYKFTKGSWNSEAVDINGNAPENYHLKISEDTILTYTLEYWANNFEKKTNGQITGDVRYHKNFKGKNINPRDLIVWLPPGYSNNCQKKYPVLYAHDGQNIFDPVTSAFGYDWQLDETADSLIKENLIEPIIIVGIYNTPSRTLEYTNTGTGKAYMSFLVNELKPFIDKTYKTKPDRDNTASIGSSAGGLISFMLAWEFPEIFSKAACLSPAFHIRDINYLPAVEHVKKKKDLKIYIDNGGAGLEQELQPGIDEMLILLLEKGYQKGKDLLWYKDETAEHNERAWAKRSAVPLEFLFGKNL